MANPVVESTGAQTATGAEDTLATINSPRNLVLLVDCTNMAAGDTVILRVKRKVRSAGSVRTIFEEALSGAQSPPGWISAPIPSPHQAVFTLQQTAGTYRAFDWSVESL